MWYSINYIGLKIAVVSYGPGKILNSDRQIKLDLELKNLFDAAVLYEYWIDTIDYAVTISQ